MPIAQSAHARTSISWFSNLRVTITYACRQQFLEDITPRLRGRACVARYADDIVVVLEDEVDAERLMKVLPKRFARFGLRLHPVKTRVVRFLRPRSSTTIAAPGTTKEPRSFDMLGF